MKKFMQSFYDELVADDPWAGRSHSPPPPGTTCATCEPPHRAVEDIAKITRRIDEARRVADLFAPFHDELAALDRTVTRLEREVAEHVGR